MLGLLGSWVGTTSNGFADSTAVLDGNGDAKTHAEETADGNPAEYFAFF